MKTILTVIGTRPEAIKLAPLLSAISNSGHFESRVCVVKQHTDLLDPCLLQLKITANYQIENNGKTTTLHESAAHILKEFGEILALSKPDLVIVQGDTTTAFAAALGSFYAKVPLAHIEAGLRTGHLDSPWPEEGHRHLIDRLATYFFAPTESAKNALLFEKIAPEKIWVVGNTSIDALRLALLPLKTNTKSRTIIVTVHRRENHGTALTNICEALLHIASHFPDVRILFFLHPNPAICQPAVAMLSCVPNIDLLQPMDHYSFIRLLDASAFIVTDSGGIQEEAPFMGKPVLVIRDTTERVEGVQEGTARLVGTKISQIIAGCRQLLEKEEILTQMSKVHYPYGDGHAAEKIVHILEKQLI